MAENWNELKEKPGKLLRKAQEESAEGVAELHNVSGSTVRRKLYDYGFVFDGENWIDPDNEFQDRRFNDETLSSWEKLRWDELKNKPELLLKASKECSTRELSRIFDISKETVRRWLRGYGFEYDGDNWFNPDSNEMTMETKKGKESRTPDIEDIGDFYIITSGDRSFQISKEKYKKIRRDYCDEIGTDYLDIPNICREHNISRKDFELLKSAFGFVHRDIRYIDDEVEEMTVDEMVDLTLEEKKNIYIKKLQQKEIKSLRREIKKYRQKDYFLEKIRDIVHTDLKSFSTNYTPPKININTNNLEKIEKMLEVSIVDLHLSKMSWHMETGEDYSLQIAEKCFLNAIEKILKKCMHYKIDKVIMPFGNDFFHYDDSTGKTTKGTSLDVDSRWQKMFSRGVKLFIKAIDMFRQITSDIEIFMVPGNHDWTVAYYAIEYLNAWYKDVDEVFVNNDPKSRKYIKYGGNLIGFTHGNEISQKRLMNLMQYEVPSKWADTQYREWHLGHKHSEKVSENVGIVIRSLPSVTGQDRWHHTKGYGSYRRNQVFFWGKEAGDFDISVINNLT